MAKKSVGKVTHFFSKISVAVLELADELKVGDTISIEGRGETVEQTVDSMQIEHENIETAKAGDSIGLKTVKPVKPGDEVFKVEGESEEE